MSDRMQLAPEFQPRAPRPRRPRQIPQLAQEPISLETLTDVEPCIRRLYSQRNGSFTNFSSACFVHHWVSDVHGDEWSAIHEPCKGALQQEIARSRAIVMINGQFQLVGDEDRHES